MQRINVTASAKIFIKTPDEGINIITKEKLLLKISDNESQNNENKIITLQGRVEKENVSKEHYLTVVRKTLAWLSIFLDVPVSDIFIVSYDIWDEQGKKGRAFDARAMKIKGILPLRETTISNFNKLLHSLGDEYP